MRKFIAVLLPIMMLSAFYAFTSGRILPTTPTVAVAASTAPVVALPKPKMCIKADKGEGYFRATNDFFKKFKLMTICDEKYGAVNVKLIDDVMLTNRPKTGPLVIDGCVATVAGYENRESYAGCRVAVTGASEVDGKIVLHTAEGNFSL